MKSWKTTLSGAVGALGIYLSNQPDHNAQIAGQVLVAVGALLVGLFARDNNVSSEEAGVK